MDCLKLRQIDRVEILTVIDNSTDVLLASSDRVKRPALKENALVQEPLVAEHGYAALVRVKADGFSGSFLFDTGLSKNGLVQNMEKLGIDPHDLDTIVLSHGHADHTKGLASLLERMPASGIKLHTHPDAFLTRKLCLPNGTEVLLPPPDRALLAENQVEIIEERGASLLLDDAAILTGQIPRRSEFEKGFPLHYSQIKGEWQQDTDVTDDQAIVLHVKDKGLVILTGCGHAGIVNTISYAQELTGVDEIYAVLGGFHLSGPMFEPIIEPTVSALKEFNPAMIVPGHCTGWKAIHEIARQLPEAFVPNSVGTLFVLD